MTWPQETRDRAEAILARYPEPRSAVMPLLYLAMREDQGLTPDGMRHVAEYTGLTPVQVESVASFYTMFKGAGVGQFVLSVCTSISCHLLGGDEVLAAVADEAGVRPGGTDDSGTVFIERAECIGACGGAPAAQVNYEMVEGLTPEAGRRLCRWLIDDRPELINSDEMQERFGGQRAFDWGPDEPRGAIGPYPAFGPLGTVGEKK
jgi:NADH:ubiquinone oxidoreductase subunit E